MSLTQFENFCPFTRAGVGSSIFHAQLPECKPIAFWNAGIRESLRKRKQHSLHSLRLDLFIVENDSARTGLMDKTGIENDVVRISALCNRTDTLPKGSLTGQIR